MKAQYLHVNGRFAAQYDEDVVMSTFRECKTQAETARRLGMGTSTVGKIVRRNGVHLGKGGRPPLHDLPMKEVERRYLAGETLQALAEHYGVRREVIRRRLRTRGVERRSRGGQPGRRNPQWKGGRKAPMHYYRRQSYEVAAICLGQPLPPGWVIHHLDENPENNQPENLMLFSSQSIHARFHQQLLRLQREGHEVDATQLALESGGRALPPPPRLIEFSRGIDQLFP
jgi:hypothetical protein